MNKLQIHAMAIALGLAFSAGAGAQNLSKEQYQSDKDGIAAEFKSAKAACGSLSGNARDICKAEAGGREKVAAATLEAGFKPSREASYKLRVARADADYSVAREHCDDSAGNVKNVCVQQAKAAATAAKADAKAQLKTANANDVANEKGAEARKDAAADKRDADYAVAKEKCEVFAGDAKSACMNEAKARFGRS